MNEQQSGLGGNTYDAHHLPEVRLDTHQAAQRAQTYRQAAYEAADHGYTGHSAGLHPDHRPFVSTDLTPGSVKRAGVRTHTPVSLSQDDAYELVEDESYYTTRLPTSARRYHVSPEAVYQQGNQRLHIRYVDVPPRSSRHAQLPPQRESRTDDYEGASVRARRLHWFVWLGVVVCVMLFGWIALSQLGAWIQAKQDDLTYGQVRHFDVNAVVGHNDSPTNPSHFTAENNNGDIFVIELPGGDSSKARIFQITTIPGNDGNPPVRISFQDVNRDGKPDMIVQIGDPNALVTVILLNNGQTFVSKV